MNKTLKRNLKRNSSENEEFDDELGTQVFAGEIRFPDRPKHKEAIISRLFGEFIGFLKAQNLTAEKEYSTQTTPILDCSRKVIWIDEVSKTHRIVIHLCSLSCLVEYGVLTQDRTRIKPDEKIDNLRYKLSSGTEVELIDAHQKKIDALFEKFKEDFRKLKENLL